MLIGSHGFSLNARAFTRRSPARDSLKMVVKLEKTEHTLYYIPSVKHIDYTQTGNRPDTVEVVPAWQLSNDKNVKVKAMARGANMVALNISETKYVWENIEGAVYYGSGTANFPYARGLSLNGGVRFAAGTAEHGFYYDSDWDVSNSTQENSKSIIFSIVDNEENRYRAAYEVPRKMTEIAKPEQPLLEGLSWNEFSNETKQELDEHGNIKYYDVVMSKYPVTNMTYTLNITLVDGEDFVRLRMSVKNSASYGQNAEAWLPMTFPIDEESMILSHQKRRWRRDNWCFKDLPNMVTWGDHKLFDTCLDWPTGGIFYDFPEMDGRFHGVVTDSKAGQGVVYVIPEKKPGDLPHYTKMWSWGNKQNFVQGGGSALTQGRPSSEYYEPWSSGFNFAFFNNVRFEPNTDHSWEIAILPITSGLNSKNKAELLQHVDNQIAQRSGLQELEPVKKTPL